MPYGIIQKLLAKQLNDYQDTVLIESPFRETTRSGTYLRSVLLGVTPKKMIVATNNPHLWNRDSSDTCETPSADRLFEIRSVYPMQAVKFSIFKRSKRQSLKASFRNSTVRYYELGNFDKRKIFWELWCNHAMESSSGTKLWPFTPNPSPLHSQETLSDHEVDFIQLQDIINKNQEMKNKKKWSDKHLYLGTKREMEDQVRPRPLPGLGPTEDIKLMYLKPRYFGCWEQSEHWVQCESVQDIKYDYNNEYTYTGGPTSNITYTSLMTTVIFWFLYD